MKFELTVTLKPYMYTFTAKEQFKMTRDKLVDIIGKRCCTAVAELTRENNIHYHCIVNVEGELDRDALLNRFRPHSKIFGKKSLEQVRYEASFEKYVCKDIQRVALIIGQYPVIMDGYCIDQKDFFPRIHEDKQELKDYKTNSTIEVTKVTKEKRSWLTPSIELFN